MLRKASSLFYKVMAYPQGLALASTADRIKAHPKDPVDGHSGATTSFLKEKINEGVQITNGKQQGVEREDLHETKHQQ